MLAARRREDALPTGKNSCPTLRDCANTLAMIFGLLKSMLF